MRLLLFSDLHADASAPKRIVGLAENADVAIGAGAFTNLRTRISTCIAVLREIEIPTVLVPGNNESYDELQGACGGWPGVRVLHGTGCEINGVPFFGIG